jgi:2-oxoisovalerate dehydrogenase E1 component alpha subunit
MTEIAERKAREMELLPGLEPVQLLQPDGTFRADERYPIDLPPEAQLSLYELMVVTRALDQEFINLQRQGELALFPSCRGQEAAQVGSAYALELDDWLFPQYRELGAFLVRGVDPVGIAELWRGVRHGAPGLLERNIAPISIPVGTHALHAVGMAMGASLDNLRSVAVAYIGDGATSVGDVHEAMNFAGVYAAPCIFFVQNNQWAISVPVEAQTKAPSIAHKAVGYGIPGIRVDGNDVLACVAVTRVAAERARAGEGPTLIEAVTYRMEAHTTSDDPTRYRSDEEVAAWAALDPLSRYAAYLKACGLWSESHDAGVKEKAGEAIARLRAALVTVAEPDPAMIFDHVYADPPPAIRRQAEQLRSELTSEDA